MIPQNVIDQILTTVDIAEYISKDVTLKRAGHNHIGCCPFHAEKTGSFNVSSTKGIFKCFGCGESGNIFSWVMKRSKMTFPEAVQKLANENNIQFEQRELTPQEKESAFKRESIVTANEAANKFYIEQLNNHSEAKKYCTNRWGEAVIKEMEIGFAPQGWTTLLDYMTSKQYDLNILVEAGLVKYNEEKNSYYDFFRERITIPIRDKSGNVIGFTARIIKANDKLPKFINTKDTAAFNKGQNLFGIYHAQREAYKSDTLILVEGAPDVIKLQSIGVYNSVAPLGTALTDQQIKLIKGCSKNVVMIPDQDTPGLLAAKRNGKALFQAGCNVTIITNLPQKDADASFSCRQDYQSALESNNNIDFIRWYAYQIISEAKQNEGQKLDKITEVCQLLSTCQDESKVDMYIDTLGAEFGSKRTWKSKITEARNKQHSTEIQKKNNTNGDIVEKFGFSVRNNCYYGLSSRGTEVKWSNFLMIPLAHVRGMNSKRLYLIRNEYGHEQTIEVKQEDLVSLSKFRIKTEGMGNFLWEAGETELHRLKRYLYENTITCDEITQLGWQKKYGFYAWGNGGVIDGVFTKTDEIGILKVEDKHYYLPAFSKIFDNDPQLFQFERKFVHIKANSISLRDYSDKLIQVFGNNGKVALCFLLASLFRDIIVQHTTSFPILNLFGPKGTGKSELGHSLTSFFVTSNIPPNISNTTIPALAEAVAQVSNAVVHIDEYKNTIDLDRREFLKGLWDGAGRTRMNMDRDKKRETTTVDSGVVLSGQEMPTIDIALFSRLIFLTFNQTIFSEEQRALFEELTLIQKRGLSHLTNQIISHRKRVSANYASDWDMTNEIIKTRLDKYPIEDRTLRNWVTVTAVVRTLEQYLNLPFTFDDMVNIAIDGIIRQNVKTQENNELSGFWETIESLVRSMQVVMEVDYKIKALPAGVGISGFRDKVTLNPSHRYLLLQFNNVVPNYLKECRSCGATQLPKASLKYYLENSQEFIGWKKAERFRRVVGPNSSTLKEGYSEGSGSPSIVTTCMVFDYDALIDRYNISIEECRTINYDDDVDNDQNKSTTQATQLEVPY